MVQQLLSAGTIWVQLKSVCTDCSKHLLRLLSPILTRKSIALLVFSLLFSVTGKSQQVTINDSIATLVLDSCNEAILSKINFNDLRFIKKPDRRIDWGGTGTQYYLTILKLSCDAEITEPFLSINNTSLNLVQFYKIQQGNKAKFIYEGGRMIPYAKNRNYVWHTHSIYIGPSPSLYVIVMRAAYKNINYNYTLQSREELEKAYDHYEIIVSSYLGMAFMISAIILLACFLFKQKVFALYFGFMLCVSLWIIDHYGKLFPFLYPNAPIINEISKPLSSLGACLLLLMVQKLIFINNLKDSPGLLKATKYLQWFLIVQLILCFLFLFPSIPGILKIALYVTWHVGLLFSLVLTFLIPYYFINSGPLAKIFSLAMWVIALSAAIQLFANFREVGSYFINEHGMAFASILENSIMAFGLLYGLLIERRNKESQLFALKEEQTKILQDVINAQDNERKRIAGDLHDNIGPLLAALKINFRRILNVKEEDKQLELMHKTEGIIDDSILEIRNIAHNLIPKNLASNGLINTLSDYFKDMEQLYSKKILFNHDVQTILEPELQMNIYRIVSELVMNAVKHSEAAIISVCIHSEIDLACIYIKDNGRGFDRKNKEHKDSLGIQSAESRVQYLKGNFKLQTGPGKGTKITIVIPLINKVQNPYTTLM
ncbi:MAG: sensor histidine kinase [Ginsengibacter sp.]